ncbi:hypothetical protein DFP74_6188 [Nocardiopsis sp. Huas11]|uniref:DUF6114 domain-containing protein n=1 Tax=Nocardiopsis sp. Huas11 TaxID=2183912 RepID=UPI000EB265A1|nr:DUF6114 domain-containing protein [Nocardiopsis sp. Huas11]RKS10422.1 hypothetical protein DFP74_6188 [Nocardiopsis sp. Huas11]
MAHALTLTRAWWSRFRTWRSRRPFLGGFLLLAAGVEILVAPAAQTLVLPIDLIIYSGIAGISGSLIGLLLIAIGVLSWLQPAQNSFFGLVGLLLALVSFVTSNFGGFVIGMLLGIVGAAFVFAWGPRAATRSRRRGRRRTGASADAAGADGPDAPPGADVPGASAALDGEAVPDVPEAADGPVRRPGPDPVAAVAAPLLLSLLLAAAPPPAIGWPWDWFTPPGGDEESTEEPSEEPSPEPSASPGDESGDENEDEEPPEDEGTEEDEDEETQETEEAEDEDGEAAECALLTGQTALAETEEEFLDAVRDCQAADDAGELPEVPVGAAYDCSRGSIRTSGLTSQKLVMSGASYDGVVECPTADGPRRYLKLTMSRADFTDAELWFEDAGVRMSLGLPTMEMNGDVQMHITRMHVRILGIPLTFTPDFPPPLLLPYMIVTDVDVDSPLASTDTMIIPGLNSQHAGT